MDITKHPGEKLCLLPAVRSDWGCLQRVSQLFFGYTMNGPNWVQTIWRGPCWMCFLAETSFPFLFFSLSHFFLFFSAGKWWHSSGQWSQVLQGLTALDCPSVCACIYKSCLNVLQRSRLCACVHAFVCMGMSVPGLFCLKQPPHTIFGVSLK